MCVRLLSPLLVASLLFAPGQWLRAQQPGEPAPPAPLSDAQRKQQFLHAREEMLTLPATPSSSATPRPRPRPHATPVPEAATPPPATPRPTPLLPVATPRPSPPKPLPESTPKPHPKTEPFIHPAVTPPPVTPPPMVTPTPGPPPPITVQKSGFEESRGLEPPSSGGWFTKWKYLPKSIQDAIQRAPVQQHRWRYLVVHNSGTRQGNAKAFDYYHRHVRKMQNGLAYHFVIGNGTSSGDGQVEIGDRWTRQINGGHVHSDYLNNIALGICLVGDFNRDVPTQRQLNTLDELLRFLRNRVGTIDREPARVYAHREINPPRWPTDCPGSRFPYDWLHRTFPRPRGQ